MTGNAECAGVDAIIRINKDSAQAYIPPLSDYRDPSPGWTESEHRCWTADAAASPTVGYWTGEPGEVSFDAWPYTEVCSILSGSIGLRDAGGRTVVFGPGEGFLVPKGWRGSWLTLEPTEKIFVALG
jgi:uncharacterized cupin superfamily protein